MIMNDLNATAAINFTRSIIYDISRLISELKTKMRLHSDVDDSEVTWACIFHDSYPLLPAYCWHGMAF